VAGRGRSAPTLCLGKQALELLDVGAPPGGLFVGDQVAQREAMLNAAVVDDA
jgi:hypothetical protein